MVHDVQVHRGTGGSKTYKKNKNKNLDLGLFVACEYYTRQTGITLCGM